MHGKARQSAKGAGGSSSSSSFVSADGKQLDIQKLLKDIEFLGSSRMTWKERKDLENRKVVSLGGKPPKKHRMPLSVAKVPMKKQKEREARMQQEGIVLGNFGGRHGNSSNRGTEKRKAEDRVLKTSEGHFSKGVLDVKHLLRQGSSSRNSESRLQGLGNLGGFGNEGKKKNVGGKKKSKKGKRAGGKKRR